MKGTDSNHTQIWEKSRRILSSIRAVASELKLCDLPPLGITNILSNDTETDNL